MRPFHKINDSWESHRTLQKPILGLVTSSRANGDVTQNLKQAKDSEQFRDPMPETFRILLVEDDRADARLVQDYLKGDPRFQLTHVKTLQNSFATLEKCKIDIVLLDLNLPDSANDKTVLDFKHEFPEIPVLVLTHSADESDFRIANSQGADDFLVKAEIRPAMLKRCIIGHIERETLKQQSKTLRERLEHSQRLEQLGQLVGGIAHDFNNKLMVILNGLNCVIENKPPQDQEICRQNLLKAKDAAVVSAGLVKQLLAFSKKQVLAPKALDLNELIRQSFEMLGSVIPKNIKIKTDFEKDLPLIYFDPIQAEQIVSNLMINARDAMPDGGEVRIETSCQSRPNKNLVRMCIADTGCGINQENLEHIFEPYFTTKASDAGTGLGLAVVFGILEQGG